MQRLLLLGIINPSGYKVRGIFVRKSPIAFLLSCSLFFIAHLNAQFFDSSVDTEKFYKEWQSDPSIFTTDVKYYDFFFNGIHFKGRRDWEERWHAIKNTTSFEGKKVLDLGSHIGMNSIFISKYLPIKELVSAEKKEAYIKKHLKFMDIFNLQYNVLQIDLDNDEYESILGYDYDIIVCLSLFRWVKDKDRFLNYLSKFQEVIYEGHPNQLEIERFAKIGFTHYKLMTFTSSVISQPENKTRPIILFSKDPIFE